MKLERTKPIVPRPAGTQRLTGGHNWRQVLSPLVHPLRLEIVDVLIEADTPLAVEDIARSIESARGDVELVRHHAMAMVEAGALTIDPCCEGRPELWVPDERG